MDTSKLFDLGQEGASPDAVARVKAACEEAVKIGDTIDAYDSALKDARRKLHILRTKTIPEAMAEAGIGDIFSLADGTQIKVSQFVSGTLPKDDYRKGEAIKTLAEIGGEALVKKQVVVDFGKGSDNAANDLAEHARVLGYEPTVKETVHPQTLQAFAREKLKKGEPIPLETLGLYAGNVAKITKKK